MSLIRRQNMHIAGFTLVEVISALIIFSVGIIALIEGVGSAIRRQSDLLDRQRAAMIAENIMEEINYTRDLETGENDGQQEGEDERFAWRTNVEETDEEGLMLVTVEVTWGEDGARGIYSLDTLMMEASEDETDFLSDTSMESSGNSRGQARSLGGTR